MPQDIVSVNRSKLADGAKLSDWITWNDNKNKTIGPFTIDIKNPETGTVVYTIVGDMQLFDYVNTFNGKAYTNVDSFHGLIGPSF